MSPSTSGDEPRISDDPLAFHRIREIRDLENEQFTAKMLATIAQQHGYTFLDEGLLRVWVHRGRFPVARERNEHARGKPGIWYHEDAVRLLDLCALHSANSREEAIQLGMWLMGYTPADGVSIADLIGDQVGRIERALYGRALTEESGSLPDEDVDRIAEQIERVTQVATHLDELCSRLVPPPVEGPHGSYFEEVEAQHPRAFAQVTRTEMKWFTQLRHAGDASRSVIPATPYGAVLPYLEARSEALKRALRPDVSTERVEEIMRSTFPSGVLISSNVSGEELTALQRDLVSMRLWRYGGLAGMENDFSLPHVHSALSQASDEELQEARTLTAHFLLGVLHEQQVLPTPALAGLTWLADRSRWHLRRLFAAPAFFPLTAYLIATFVSSLSYRPYLFVRLDVLSIALDQLARLSRESVSRAEAFLTVLFTVIPDDRREVSEQEA